MKTRIPDGRDGPQEKAPVLDGGRGRKETQTCPTIPATEPNVNFTVIQQINTLHSELCGLARTSLEKAIRIGELLVEQKSKLAHGQWLPWVTGNLTFTDRTARNYIRLFNEKDRLKSETISDLSTAYKLLSAPATAPEDDLETLAGARCWAEIYDRAEQTDRWTLRGLEFELKSPDLTLARIHAIVRESTRIIDESHRREIDRQTMLGRYLIQLKTYLSVPPWPNLLALYKAGQIDEALAREFPDVIFTLRTATALHVSPAKATGDV